MRTNLLFFLIICLTFDISMFGWLTIDWYQTRKRRIQQDEERHQ